MPNGVRRQLRASTAPPFDDLVAEAQQFSDHVGPHAEFVDEDELLDEEHVEGQEDHEDQIGELLSPDITSMLDPTHCI